MPARTAITLSTKIEILDKPGASLKFVADKFKIGKTTVADIKKQKQSLLSDFNNPNLNNKDRKRKREGKHGDIVEALFIWFKEKRSQGVMPSCRWHAY